MYDRRKLRTVAEPAINNYNFHPFQNTTTLPIPTNFIKRPIIHMLHAYPINHIYVYYTRASEAYRVPEFPLLFSARNKNNTVYERTRRDPVGSFENCVLRNRPRSDTVTISREPSSAMQGR